jgi:hypothetical protein
MEAFEAEAAFQRQLAKKLGIKGKKRKAAAPPEKEAAEELDAMFAGLPSLPPQLTAIAATQWQIQYKV